MFTQCPDCGTVFRVTATVLRAARGQVRCGVCDATFDALQYLTEESDLDGDEGGASPAGGARAQDAASLAPDDAEVASPDGGPDDDEDHDDDGDVDDGRGAEGTGEAGDDDRAERGTRSVERYYDDTGEHEGFPLEQLDDPIDVIATPGSGPTPEFPPFAPDDVVTSRAAPQDAAASGHYEIAIDDGEPTPTSPAAATLASVSVAATASASLDPFVHRAGRNTPSADEDRALAEIAAALARRAQSAPSAERDGALADDDVPSLEIELLDPSVAENIVLSGQDDVSDSALEFNLPIEDWDRVFVPDEAAATIPPLDPALAEAQGLALGADGDADGADGADDVVGDLDVDTDADVRDRDRDRGRNEPRASAGDDDIEIDLDDGDQNDAGHRDEDEDDGDLDPADLRERAASPQAAAPAFERPEDPLSRTDEFPPLRVTPAEEAAAGVAGTPDAKPRTGVPLDEFDALVAAAAARAAAQVAARVGGAATPSATPAASLPTGTAAEADATAPGAARGGAAFRDPLVDALDGTAESAWFTARRDLAPEGAAITSAESPETIQFDAQRFQAIVRGRRRRPWWRTALYVVGSLVLALTLGAQAVHFWRESLAQHTMFGPPLRELYARLGLPLEPRWNLAAFDVKQWGATADVQPGTLRVRASIVNRAARAQPHPMLRVTLLDRFSAKVARREFTPAEYLPGRTAPTDMLAAGARVDADLVIADPGSDAVGFELDVCLKRRGVLECAGDAKLALP